MYSDGPFSPPRLQPKATCTCSAAHPICTRLPANRSSLSRLASFVRKILQQSRVSTKKPPHNAGFLVEVASQAADALASQSHALSEVDARSMYEAAASQATSAGVFRDVGRQAGTDRLPTCWPLVQEAFRFVSQQVCLICIRTANRRDTVQLHYRWMQELQPCVGLGLLLSWKAMLPSNMHHTSFASKSPRLNHSCIVHIEDNTR